MKLKNLFKNEVLQEAKEKNLIGLEIDDTVIDESTVDAHWIGSFYCNNEKLTSLYGSPYSIDGTYVCSFNKLTSLEGAPHKVSVHFTCSNNRLTTLTGSPNYVGGSFMCDENLLTTLEGCTDEVGGHFICGGNQLTSFKGGPSKVGASVSCMHNKLTSLDGVPKEIGSDFICNSNSLTSLKNIHKQIKKMHGRFLARGNPIKSHVLGLMLIDGITSVELDNEEVENILNNANKKHWTEVQAELEEAGFEEYAQL